MINATDIQNAIVTLKGDEWGDVPLWTLEEKVPTPRKGAEPAPPSWSMDVHATDEADARAQALVALAAAVPAPAPLELLVVALEKLPPDQVVTAADLLAALKPA